MGKFRTSAFVDIKVENPHPYSRMYSIFDTQIKCYGFKNTMSVDFRVKTHFFEGINAQESPDKIPYCKNCNFSHK